MKQKSTPYIYTVFFIVLSHGIFAQKLHLKITSKNKSEHSFLQQINFEKTHTSEKSVQTTLLQVSEQLRVNGYFFATIDSLVKINNERTAYFSLGAQTKKISIHITDKTLPLTNYNIDNDSITLKIDRVPHFLSTISKQLDQDGQSFAEVTLKNITLKEQTLYATLDIKRSKKRTIDKIIVNGYDRFSTAHIRHFLQLRKGTIFNQQKLQQSSAALRRLHFVSEIKPPEVLFSKDSTIVYIYVKKKLVNSFDGLLNFSSKENGKGLLFNGHLDLKLNNILHTGEQFELLWKANGAERQQFQITTKIPYVFNSAFSPEMRFNIYKQDSTFLNTKFHGGLTYTISPEISTGITYDSESSSNTLQNKNNATVKDFSNTFFGLQFSYTINNEDQIFPNPRFMLQFNPSYGYRNSSNRNTRQFKIGVEAMYQWFFNHRNSIFIRNHSGYLNSDNFLTNELYRIGGATSIRGFNEESLFVSQFSYLNIEYRYLTSLSSYIYTISDIGIVKTDAATSRETLLGLGLGYLFHLKNTKVSLEYVLGKTSKSSFDFNNSKIAIKIISFF